MSSGVKITRLRYCGVAECESPGCPLSADASREECRAHVRETGHTTRFLIEDSTKYEPEGNDHAS
jgi:hypothetical protein